MPSIMIIDDQFIGRKLLEKLVSTLDDNAEINAFSNPQEALAWAERHPPDLVLTDYKMPLLNGAEFTQRFRQLSECADVPLVVVTCIEDREVRYQALDAGATDFLTKPVDHAECRARCKNLLTLHKQQKIIKDRAAWLERQVSEATREIREREQETLLRLAKAGEYRDEETGYHVLRMSRYCTLICQSLGLSEEECHVIQVSAPMHDIGKIGISDSILLKPGKHTPEEFELMKTHTLIGYEILKDSPSKFLQMGAVIALGHHERYDGSGYPYGLKKEEIPLSARVVAVADVFDALTSVRPYKPAWPVQDALNYLRKERGSHFDPNCVDAFLPQRSQIIAIYNDLRDVPAQQIK